MVSPAAATSNAGSASTSGDSAIISANDFLTLLVTEMQNQDPTADTDPNEYINQLVSVNSLEQLISINQNLATALGDSTDSTQAAESTQAAGAVTPLTAKSPAATAANTNSAASAPKALEAAQSALTIADTSSQSAVLPSLANLSTGNLSVPAANPAATRVAHALDGRTRAQPIP
jgi:flagellar basal-body rod modification protein FlgD